MANGGTISITAAAARNAVNSLIQIKGELTAPVINQTGGKIVIQNNTHDGQLDVSGNVTANNASGKGGTITATAETVQVSGSIKVDGKTRGGTILIGGDYQGGNNPNIQFSKIPLPPAQTTKITETATITANATEQGDGGNIVVWAEGHTEFKGKLSAKGGKNIGNGGFAEVSGKQTLDFSSGTYDLTAENGETGNILFDPATLTLNEGDLEGIAANTTFQADNLITISDNTNDNIFSIGAYDVTFNTSVSGDIVMADVNDTIRTNGGTLIFRAKSGNVTLGHLDTTNNGGNSGADIRIFADGTTSFNSVNAGSASHLLLSPETASRTIGLNGASGDVQYDLTALLPKITANELVVGNPSTSNGGPKIDSTTSMNLIDTSAYDIDFTLFNDDFNFADITVKNDKQLKIEGLSGNLSLSNIALEAGTIVIENGSGEIDLTDVSLLAHQSSGSLIQTRNQDHYSINITSNTGDLTIRNFEIDAEESIFLEANDTANGSIILENSKLQVEEDFNATAKGTNGRIDIINTEIDDISGREDRTFNFTANQFDIDSLSNIGDLTGTRELDEIEITPYSPGINVEIGGTTATDPNALFISNAELETLNPQNELRIIGNASNVTATALDFSSTGINEQFDLYLEGDTITLLGNITMKSGDEIRLTQRVGALNISNVNLEGQGVEILATDTTNGAIVLNNANISTDGSVSDKIYAYGTSGSISLVDTTISHNSNGGHLVLMANDMLLYL